MSLLLGVDVDQEWITTDRITKPAQYAAAGIEHYWRVELEPLRLVTYRLVGVVYAETGSWPAGQTAEIDEPLPVSLEVASLQPR